MFIHLGKDLVIPLKDVIAIVDAESALKSDDTKEFFRVAEEEGFIHRIADKEIKSYIVTERVLKTKGKRIATRQSIIYTSNISSSTLYKRAGFIDNI